MSREDTIHHLLKGLLQNPTPGNIEWESFLEQLSGQELVALADLAKKESAGVLVKDDLKPHEALTFVHSCFFLMPFHFVIIDAKSL